jgi:prolyl-tRNA editing enzyme YbaK/EbsC (Cys-tRNA(Pro) deacylase)
VEAPSPLLDRVRALLEDAGAPYRHLRHPEARTTEALAAARGMPVSAGVKALVFTIKGRYTVLALRADRETDNRRVRRALGAQKLRFARLEELAALGLVPGQVPPFGEPVLPARLVADAGVLEGDVVAFTAGSATDSLVMAAADWARVARPEVLDFAR